jgi:hypothetical protein
MLTQPWLQFFIALWNRTGGSVGSNADLTQAISALSDPTNISDLDQCEKVVPGALLFSDSNQHDPFSGLANQSLLSQSDDAQSLSADTLFQSAAIADEIQNNDPARAVLNAMMLASEEESFAQLVPHPGYVPGRHYVMYDGNIGATGTVGAVDTIYLYPFYLVENVRLSSLFIRVVTGGSGSSAKAGIWVNKNGRPTGTPIVVDNTGVSTAAAGHITFNVTPTILQKGWYWVGTKFTGTLPVCTNIVGTSLLMSFRIGGSTMAGALANGATNQISGQSIADAYVNNMPDLTGSTLVDVVGASAGIPVLGFSVS